MPDAPLTKDHLDSALAAMRRETAGQFADLAVIIGKGFEHVSEDFKDIRGELLAIRGRLTRSERAHENLFAIVKEFSPKGLKQLESTVDDHEYRLSKLEKGRSVAR